MGELGLLAALLPVDVLAEHAGHPLVSGEGAQLEALDQEQVLELDLDTQCTAAAPCSHPGSALCSPLIQSCRKSAIQEAGTFSKVYSCCSQKE